MMRSLWIVFLICGGVVRVASLRIARVQPLNMERVLVERFGFSTVDIGQLRGGQVVVRTVPSQGAEIAVLGVVRIPDDKERLVRWIRDVEGFRKAAELGVSRRLSSPLDAERAARHHDSRAPRGQPILRRPAPGGQGAPAGQPNG